MSISSIRCAALFLCGTVLTTWAADGPESGLAATWDKAMVFVPGRFPAAHPGSVEVGQSLPVVLYIHGCQGITQTHDVLWGHFMKNLGYIVVMPDSFARPHRKQNCDPVSRSGGSYPEALQMRLDEINHALLQINRSPWADKENIYIMGHSEGGAASAIIDHAPFRGVILSATYFRTRNHGAADIIGPYGTPVLLLEWSRDSWCLRDLSDVDCEVHELSGHANLKQIILDGSGHDTYERTEAREAVARFLLSSPACPLR